MCSPRGIAGVRFDESGKFGLALGIVVCELLSSLERSKTLNVSVKLAIARLVKYVLICCHLCTLGVVFGRGLLVEQNICHLSAATSSNCSLICSD